MVLHTRLPQVLACAARVDLEDDRLIIALIRLGDHIENQALVLVFDGRDTDPK